MDIKAYIESGILELYIAGLLSEEENREVYLLSQEHPEIKEEILAIENAVKSLSGSLYPYDENKDFEGIRAKINGRGAVKTLVREPRKTNWIAYSGWAAAVLMAFGLLYFAQQTNTLESEMEAVSREAAILKEEIIAVRENNQRTKSLLNGIRDKDITVIPLAGQEIAPESYAKVYWNKEKDLVYMDVAGLPDPPPGMVYQVWSLKLNPLTPTSIGVLDDFLNDDSKVFALANPNESEAFGITLEPAGGSEMPTLTQLYTLGAVQSG